jgi:hypothetical protein
VLMGANVTYLYKMHDYMVGHLLFIIIGVLSSLQVLSLLHFTFENQHHLFCAYQSLTNLF